MGKMYIVKKVFEDKDDKKNRYPINSIVSFDDEERINDLLERGIIKEFIIDEGDSNIQSIDKIINKENVDNKTENDDKTNKSKKGDK